MVLIRGFLILAGITLSLLSIGAPASAHKNHQQAQPAAAQPAAAPANAAVPPSEMQQQMEAHAKEMEAQAPQTFMGRLTSWFGRMHPFAVHFPIALFPVAFVALVLARRRGEAVELIRALIIVAGAASVIAAALGWLNGGLTLSDSDTLLMLHRWLGTLLGLFGGLVGWWAWRRRSSVDSGLMVGSIGAIVGLLLVQGFLGASVTHGWEHMMF
jgi:uncharacterized membrane protein